MKLRMTIDDAIAAAREWTRGTTLHADSDSPRVWCIIMIEEIEHLRARVAMLEDAENAGTAITAMPIQIGDDLCYLPVNAHGIVKRAMRDAERIDWLSRSDDEPVYIPPMIAIPDDLHPDELAGFERGAQMALNYVHNMGLLEKRDRMALYLENIARCPCCHELSACLAECTFATDDPNEHDRMMEARSALYGD